MSAAQTSGPGTGLARDMACYKAWANEVTYNAVLRLPDKEISKVRKSCFDSILQTLNHIYIVDDIFKAHLEGRSHGYEARQTRTPPPLAELCEATRLMDKWWIDLTDRLSEEEFYQTIEFEFVDGGKGAMTRLEIILHLVDHSNYHRGYVDDMMYDIPHLPPASDYSVYLCHARVRDRA